MRSKILHGIFIGIVSSTLGLMLYYSEHLQWLENATWDWRVRKSHDRAQPSDQIQLVFLDQKSLDWGTTQMGLSWPWPRQVYAPLLKFCERAGVKSLAFDAVFTEQSPYDVADDEAFGAAISSLGCYAQAFHLAHKQGLATKWPEALPKPKTDISGLNEYIATKPRQKNSMHKGTFPIHEIASKAAILGSVEGVLEKDAIIRRASPFNIFDGRFIPSLSLATLLAADSDMRIKLERNSLSIDKYVIPLDRYGRAILNYLGASQAHNTVRLSAVINSELQISEGKKPLIDPSLFKNKHVLVGMTAAGLRDLRPTPVSKEYPGVEIHATMLDNIINNDFITDASILFVIAGTLLFSIFAALCGRFSHNWIFAALAFLVLLPMPLISGLVAYSYNIWLPVAPVTISVALALIAAFMVNYANEGKQKRFIKNAFKQYLSPHVIDKLVRNPDDLKLGGEKRELSIYFSDVQGFTSISEGLDPEELTSLLNEYLSAMTSIIHDQGGTIDKYEGDAIIAFWNAPLDNEQHACNAVRAALLGQEKLLSMRPEFKQRIGKDLFARIGINTGQVVVGNMGSEQRFDYTFLGDAGNLAARLEGINKQFGTFLMISEHTVRQLSSEFTCRELSTVQVVGRNEAVRVYEPYFTTKADTEFIDSFDIALKLYYAGSFNDAAAAFMQLADKDAVSAIYERRCKHLADNPPDNWQGIWTMTEK